MPSGCVSTFATSKRIACDRCHAMKLRCPSRDELGMQPCSRCVRARAECVVSYNRPLGRRARLNIPPTVQTTQPANHSPSAVLGPPENVSSPSHRRGSHRSSISSVATSPRPTTPTSRQLQGMEPLDFSGDLSALFNYQDDALLSYGLMVPDTGADAAVEPALDQLDHSWIVDSLDTYRGAQVPQPPPIQCDPHLAGLNHELSQQLHAWNQRLKVGASIELPRSLDQPLNSTEVEHSNPFRDALQAMSKLVAIGQRYKSRPSIVIVLQLLTAYLQVVGLCDHLFTRLQGQLQDTTGSKSQPMQSLPGLQLAGVTVQQGDLQTKILVQAILHYFQTFEKALSLPRELCLYEPQMGREGLLDQDQDQVLIQALLRSEIPGIEGLRSLASLRNNIAQVRRHLSI